MESEKRAFSLGNAVLTKGTRRRYFAGRIAPKRTFSAGVATHDRKLGKDRNNQTIGLYTQTNKKNSDFSELDGNWWPRPGSNRRHTDFQSVALPTELPSHGRELANGRSRGIRTHDPVIKSHLLYQLSYAPIHNVSPSRMERAKGLEPSTTTLARWHSTN